MSWFIENFKKFDKKISIVFKNQNYSYDDLYNQIKKIENELLPTIEKGKVVSILSDYSFESIALLIALYKNKNIIVPITTTIESEIKERIKESYSDKIIKIIDRISVPNLIPLISCRLIKNTFCIVGVCPPNLKRLNVSFKDSPNSPLNMDGMDELSTL